MPWKKSLLTTGVITLALAAVAIAATGASAVTLCRANENPTCSEANSYRVPTEFVGVLERSTNAVFSGTPTATCEESGGTGETTVEGTPLIGEGKTVYFGGCSGCTTVEARNLPWTGEVEATGGGNGTLTVTGSKEGNPSVKITGCLSGATCYYGFTTATAEVEGGSSMKFKIVKVLNREEGSNKLLCALTNTFTGSYKLTSPTEPVFISALP